MTRRLGIAAAAGPLAFTVLWVVAGFFEDWSVVTEDALYSLTSSSANLR